ncbi:hypothetical protein [uncultured Nostoc sp.]|uniref:hypothetical protein n=1 Tax=uncultured Nostoc sp. TaxID=340711 RepID=UPI0035CBC632
MFLDEEEARAASNTNNYPIKEDIPLTPTELREVERLKSELLQDLSKMKALKDIAESLAIKASIYAISRMLLLCGGGIGVYFCFVTLLAAFMADNRDFFNSDDVQYVDGLKLNSMNRLLKLLLSLIGCGVFAYSTVGDYLGLVKISNDAYNLLSSKIEQFQTPISKDNEQLIAVSVGAGISFLVLVGSRIVKK